MKNSLIVYFSRADENWMANGLEVINKGNTEVLAEYINHFRMPVLLYTTTQSAYSLAFPLYRRFGGRTCTIVHIACISAFLFFLSCVL